MFNKYLMDLGCSPEMSAKIAISEHRAPTDDAMRLLNEMQEKSKENLIERYIIEDNDLKGGVFIFKDFRTENFEIVVHFTLNGKEHTVERSVPSWSKDSWDHKTELAKAMISAIAEALIPNIEVENL